MTTMGDRSKVRNADDNSEEDISLFNALSRRNDNQHKQMLAEIKQERYYRAPKAPNSNKITKSKFIGRGDESTKREHYFNQKYYEKKQNIIANKYNLASSSETRNSSKSILPFLTRSAIRDNSESRGDSKKLNIFNSRKFSYNDIQNSNKLQEEHSPIPAARNLKNQPNSNCEESDKNKNYTRTLKGVFSHLSVFKVKSTKNVYSELITSNETRPESKDPPLASTMSKAQRNLIDKIKVHYNELCKKNITVLPNKKYRKDMVKILRNKIMKSTKQLDSDSTSKCIDGDSCHRCINSTSRDENKNITVQNHHCDEDHQVIFNNGEKDSNQKSQFRMSHDVPSSDLSNIVQMSRRKCLYDNGLDDPHSSLKDMKISRRKIIKKYMNK